MFLFIFYRLDKLVHDLGWDYWGQILGSVVEAREGLSKGVSTRRVVLILGRHVTLRLIVILIWVGVIVLIVEERLIGDFRVWVIIHWI